MLKKEVERGERGRVFLMDSIGVISYVNEVAQQRGLAPGQSLRQALTTLVRAQ